MFSKKLEYGYLIMKTLKNTDKFNMMSGRDILSQAKIPTNMGLGILSQLANGGVICSAKGKNGGFYRKPQEINLFQLFYILEANKINIKNYLDEEYQKEMLNIGLLVLDKMKTIKV